ncbi:MAG: hypothetical protein B7733_13635 [Myxococcales bacterium FL481]|nr:MAG: hypothetical protein B7733_13635 [Myxococcales bacterium FL481]
MQATVDLPPHDAQSVVTNLHRHRLEPIRYAPWERGFADSEAKRAALQWIRVEREADQIRLIAVPSDIPASERDDSDANRAHELRVRFDAVDSVTSVTATHVVPPIRPRTVLRQVATPAVGVTTYAVGMLITDLSFFHAVSLLIFLGMIPARLRPLLSRAQTQRALENALRLALAPHLVASDQPYR